jgi:hypothetical protein
MARIAVTHAKVFERFLEADDTGTSLFNGGRNPDPDPIDVAGVEGTGIRSGEVGVARAGRRSPSVFRTYTRPARSRQTGILPCTRTTVRAPTGIVGGNRRSIGSGRVFG